MLSSKQVYDTITSSVYTDNFWMETFAHIFLDIIEILSSNHDPDLCRVQVTFTQLCITLQFIFSLYQSMALVSDRILKSGESPGPLTLKFNKATQSLKMSEPRRKHDPAYKI